MQAQSGCSRQTLALLRSGFRCVAWPHALRESAAAGFFCCQRDYACDCPSRKADGKGPVARTLRSYTSQRFIYSLHKTPLVQAADYLGDVGVGDKTSAIFAERLFPPGVVKDASWSEVRACLPLLQLCVLPFSVVRGDLELFIHAPPTCITLHRRYFHAAFACCRR